MGLLRVYGKIYAECLKKALAGTVKNVWTVLLPMALLFALQAAATLLAPFGLLGGFALAFVVAGLLSCYLYFVGEIVASARVSFKELARSIKAYFWSISNLLFVVWIASIVMEMVTRSLPRGEVLELLFDLALFILLNAVPEVLYQKGTWGGLATVTKTLQFIHENWIEWFIPNLGVGAGVYFALTQVAWYGLLARVLLPTVGGVLLHVMMIFRGHLFQVLDGTSHRQRMFRYRGGS